MVHSSDHFDLKQHPVHVFLCHSHVDKNAVRALYLKLHQDSVHAWLDHENLLPGQNWKIEVRRAILKSDVVIVCLSNSFNRQVGFRHEEINIALEKASLFPADEIYIVPIRLEKCDMPESLRHLHRVDLFESGGYEKLLKALTESIQD